MISRVDTNLVLHRDGKVVEVTGPITWDADETSATFSVVLAQVNAGGAIVLAHGAAAQTYMNGTGAWSALARVVGPHQLVHGEAQAFAYASVLEDGAYKPYPWWVMTTLAPAIVAAPHI